jgi:hypothetical protein
LEIRGVKFSVANLREDFFVLDARENRVLRMVW